MRFAALALATCLWGCSLTGPAGSDCRIEGDDSQCGDDVCAQGGECMTRSSVRPVLIKWTVNGAAANELACGSYLTETSRLYLQFDSEDFGDTLRFAPVACSQGQFTVTKLPKRFVKVELGVEGGASDALAIEAGASQVQFNLFH